MTGSAYNYFPEINGLLVKLRKLSIEDAKDISQLVTYNVSKSLWKVPFPYTIQDALNFIDSSHRDFISLRGLNFAIEYKNNTNDSIGLVGIIGLKDLDTAKKKGNLGYWIGERYWGKGIGTESVALVINFAFSVLGLEEVWAYVYSDNKASIRVLEKNGMTNKGDMMEYNQMIGNHKSTIKYLKQRRHSRDESES
ncbi:MAG TPA: GNAT family N-acetyltransferase [Nitrososphaeraceae archaeon]|nr:GNAT family N-acetyltransferase [Nitrososphaeraceae archaeon]